MRSTIFVKPSEIEKKWYVIDAQGKKLGAVAVAAANILRGKNKPEFAPHADNGDYVIIVNAEKVALSSGKEETKVYYRHSGYPAGLTRETFSDLIERKPEAPIEKAIKGMLPKGALGNELFRHLFVYAGSDHPHNGQHPVVYNLEEAR